MGSSRLIPFVIKMVTTGGYNTPSEWRTRAKYGIPANGKPTVENIDKYVTDYENSLRPGGVNAHLGIHSVIRAYIVDQKRGAIVADWVRREQRKNEPMFEVI